MLEALWCVARGEFIVILLTWSDVEFSSMLATNPQGPLKHHVSRTGSGDWYTLGCQYLLVDTITASPVSSLVLLAPAGTISEVRIRRLLPIEKRHHHGTLIIIDGGVYHMVHTGPPRKSDLPRYMGLK